MKVTICIGSFCHVKGAPQVIAELQRLVAEHNLKDKVELAGKFCMGRCQNGHTNGVNIAIGEDTFDVTHAEVESFFLKEILPKA